MSVCHLQEYVTRQAEYRPDATALVLGDERASYGALESCSNRLARLLKEGGCQTGDRVGLLLPKSPTTVASMLGILKAGGVYVPLDPESPPARLEKILRSADCAYLLTSTPALSVLEDLRRRFGSAKPPGTIWMERTLPEACGFEISFTKADANAMSDAFLPDAGGGGDEAAHLLFTSGSTGAPKGVVVSHTNVIAFVTWATDYFGLDETDRVSCHSPLHFDLSTYDLYGAFAAGAEVHLVPSNLNLFPSSLIDFIRDHRLTQWFSVPSILAYLAHFDAAKEEDFPDLQRILWCGEVFPTPALKYWMERLPHVTFTNLYGPTEATIASSYHTVAAPPADINARIPIGRPCGGEELLILSHDLEPLPPGAVGEIYIGGIGVTHGYWRDEERTRNTFLVLDSPTGPTRKRIYRTGDLGYRGADGLIYFVGRADSQIKSRGHRIELGEIEAALHQIPEVGMGAVVAIRSPDFGTSTICCAYVPRAGSDLPPRTVRERLAALVPKYMIPARWRRMEALPANVNGKVDRVALTELFRTEEVNHAARAASG